MTHANPRIFRSRLAVAAITASLLFTTACTPAVPNVQRHTLENGLSLILYPSKATEQVALVVLYAVGEDHDPAERCGLAHLTEHLYCTAAAGDAPARTVDELIRRYPNS